MQLKYVPVGWLGVLSIYKIVYRLAMGVCLYVCGYCCCGAFGVLFSVD